MEVNDLSGVPAEEIDADAPVRGRSRDRQWDVLTAVVIGGVLGAEARYGLSVAVPPSPSGFPWSTVYINVIGCFLLGVLMTVLGQLASPHRLIRPFVGIGILGGFTTFSTFTVDAERLIVHQRAGTAALYVLSMLILASVAVAAGTIAAQLFGRYVHRGRLRRVDTIRPSRRTTNSSAGRR